jgi:hypothetical protein
MRTEQQRAKDKATKLHSVLVRARGACERCGRTENLQCAHIISRRYSHTRCRLDNAFCLCAGCHIYLTQHPLSMANFVKKEIGINGYMELKSISQRTEKVDWLEQLEFLRSILHAT